MKSLEELSSYVCALPCRIAEESSTVAGLEDLGEKTNVRDGFPSLYSSSSSNPDHHILLRDFNGFAMMASDELHYKEIGCVHTFNSESCASTDGYPEWAVLHYTDGVYDKLVESQVSNNDKNFVDSPSVIDRVVDGVVYWKTRSMLATGDADRFSIGVDFDKGYRISYGSELKEDALVVVSTSGATTSVTDFITWAVMSERDRHHQAVEYTVSIDAENGSTSDLLGVHNRGTQGNTGVIFPIPLGPGGTFNLSWYGLTEGTQNFVAAFFVKKGTKVGLKYSSGATEVSVANGVPNSGKIYSAIAFPLVTGIKSEDTEGEEA